MNKSKKAKMKLANDLYKEIVFDRYGPLCQKCLSEGKHVMASTVHHPVHKTQGMRLRYHPDNGIPICDPCHDLDFAGKLLPWCIEFLGVEEYNKLRAMRSRLKVDLDDIIAELRRMK